MTNINLKELTPKQRQAWEMRYTFGWKVERIALEMGITQPAVTQLLNRAERGAGLRRKTRVRMIRTEPRLIKARSLSITYHC